MNIQVSDQVLPGTQAHINGRWVDADDYLEIKYMCIGEIEK